MMLYRNTKAMVRSLDGDTDFFDIVAGVLQGDTLALASCMFIIWLNYILLISIDQMKENDLSLKKGRSKPYSVETTKNADYGRGYRTSRE